MKKGKEVGCFGEFSRLPYHSGQVPLSLPRRNLGVIDPTTGEMWNGFSSYLIEYSDTFLGRGKSRQGKQGKYGRGEQRWSGFYLLLPHNLNVLYVCFSLHCSAFFFLPTSSALYGRYCKVGVSKNVL